MIFHCCAFFDEFAEPTEHAFNKGCALFAPPRARPKKRIITQRLSTQRKPSGLNEAASPSLSHPPSGHRVAPAHDSCGACGTWRADTAQRQPRTNQTSPARVCENQSPAHVGIAQRRLQRCAAIFDALVVDHTNGFGIIEARIADDDCITHNAITVRLSSCRDELVIDLHLSRYSSQIFSVNGKPSICAAVNGCAGVIPACSSSEATCRACCVECHTVRSNISCKLVLPK